MDKRDQGRGIRKKGNGKGQRSIFKSRKGFIPWASQARTGPSNTAIGDFLSDGRYTGAVLAFLRATRVGDIKEGVICKWSQ